MHQPFTQMLYVHLERGEWFTRISSAAWEKCQLLLSPSLLLLMGKEATEQLSEFLLVKVHPEWQHAYVPGSCRLLIGSAEFWGIIGIIQNWTNAVITEALTWPRVMVSGYSCSIAEAESHSPRHLCRSNNNDSDSYWPKRLSWESGLNPVS